LWASRMQTGTALVPDKARQGGWYFTAQLQSAGRHTLGGGRVFCVFACFLFSFFFCSPEALLPHRRHGVPGCSREHIADTNSAAATASGSRWAGGQVSRPRVGHQHCQHPLQVLVRIVKFAFTANNVSYATAGTQCVCSAPPTLPRSFAGATLKYFEFFAAGGAEKEMGIIPTWGIGVVTVSRHPAVEEGTRYASEAAAPTWSLGD
jgi:hypothetical protein